MSLLPNGFIDQRWKSITPLAFSRTHPSLYNPQPPLAPPPLVSITPSFQIESTLTPQEQSASPQLVTPPSSRFEVPEIRSDFSGTSSQLFASEIFFTGDGLTIKRRESPKKALLPSEDALRGLDRFAKSYQPLWLTSLPRPTVTFYLPPLPPFPTDDYCSSIYTTRQIYSPLDISRVCASLLSLPPCTADIQPLDAARVRADPKYYAEHFTALLSLYLSAQVEEMEKALIHMVPLHLPNNADFTYRLQIPGIREDSPRLSIGDRLILRGLDGVARLPSPVAVQVEVIGMMKAQGWVYVRSSHLAAIDAAFPRAMTDGVMAAMYQVQFSVSVAPLCAMQDAVRTISTVMGMPGNDISRRWLFPEPLDIGHLPKAVNTLSVSWVDDTLNEEQKSAVYAVSTGEHRVPYLISGPPGVRKTKTLVEAVLQILNLNPEASILVCAPSNPAADTLARRLKKTLQPKDMLRLNAPSRTFAEVPDELLPYCCVKGDQFDLPPFEQLMGYRVVVSTCVDAGILVSARATNMEMMRAEVELYSTLHPLSRRSKKWTVSPHWTHLLIDEAGQASEPEVLIPLSVVLPQPLVDNFDSTDPIVVLCGDIHQLGPIIPSYKARQGELDISLLERLFECDLYSAHPNARKNIRHNQTVSLTAYTPFTNLVKNYRSIAPILMVPAALFYEDTLQPAARDVSLIQWSGLPNPRIPILFQGTDTEEHWVDEGASWFNSGEISISVDIVRSLLAERPDIRQEEIAIISPWREQVWRTRHRLRLAGFGRVDVGNVESYQGAEFRVTIVSCVRSSARFLDHDREANMGLYNERKRFNVAITRAKELLIVVGNANLLKGDPFWNGFLQIMLRNNLCRGPVLDLEMTGAYISDIESSIRSEETMGNDEAVLYLAGSVARATLRDE